MRLVKHLPTKFLRTYNSLMTEFESKLQDFPDIVIECQMTAFTRHIEDYLFNSICSSPETAAYSLIYEAAEDYLIDMQDTIDDEFNLDISAELESNEIFQDITAICIDMNCSYAEALVSFQNAILPDGNSLLPLGTNFIDGGTMSVIEENGGPSDIYIDLPSGCAVIKV